MRPASFWLLLAAVAFVLAAVWLGWHMPESGLGFNLGGVSK